MGPQTPRFAGGSRCRGAGAAACDPQGKGRFAAGRLAGRADGGFQWALTLDGDGQHATEDIPAFFELVDRTGATAGFREPDE